MKVSSALNSMICANNFQYNTIQVADSTTGLMLSMGRFAVEMILTRSVVNRSYLQLHNHELFIQDGIYPDHLPGGYDGMHFVKNTVYCD